MPSIELIHPAVAKGVIAATGVASASFATDHLYVDDNGGIRDTHIEDMFDDLFYGRPLDQIFQQNFAQYFSVLTGGEKAVPSGIFDNVIEMRQWVGQHFGDLDIGPPVAATIAANPDLAHCAHRAIFKEPMRFQIDASYAPTELNAGLLCVVSVYRQLSKQFNDSMFKASDNELN